MKTEISAESGKSALALIGAAAASLTLNQWVAMATGVYVVIQVAYLVRKWWREEKDWARGA
jgi:4-hydroxybenzoate polyprenyltransferase